MNEAQLISSPFIEENEKMLYHFAYFFLGEDEEAIEEILFSSFQELAQRTRKIFILSQKGKSRNAFEIQEMKILLFSIAWKKIEIWVREKVFSPVFGRDTRISKKFEGDFLNKNSTQFSSEELRELMMSKFSQLDMDFKVPVILKDVLKFSDEEVAKILKLRWGVYRHRLHRGRLELCESLKNKPYSYAVQSAGKEIKV